MTIQEFIEQNKQDILSLMKIEGLGFYVDQGYPTQEDIEDYILNNPELYNYAIKSGVEF